MLLSTGRLYGGGGGGGGGPINTVLPAVTGTARAGNTLSCSTGTWTGSGTISYTYQWKRAGSSIGGATASTYDLVGADIDSTIACQVTATDTLGSTPATSSATASIATGGDYVTTVNDDVGRNSYTFNTVSIGAAHADRVVVLEVFYRVSATIRTLSAVTFNGNAATILAQSNAGADGGVALVVLPVAAGTTANFVLTFTSTVASCRIATYRVIPASSTAVDSGAANGSGSPVTVADIEVKVGGYLILAAIRNNDAAGTTPSYNGVDTPVWDLNALTAVGVTSCDSWSAHTTENVATNDPGGTGTGNSRMVAVSYH